MPAPNVTARKPAAKPRMTLAEVMDELARSGSEQTRKTYARHGAAEPMFGVSFATLKALMRRIGVDHDLALALWETGNYDARNLAVKIVDPPRLSSAELDRWAHEASAGCYYTDSLAAEGPLGAQKLSEWLAARDERTRAAGWTLLGTLAQRDATLPDALFAERLAEIARNIHEAPNDEREAMNDAVIAIGCRSAALREAALDAAMRIGKVEIDHGDTACKTREAATYIAKAWEHSTSKGFESPAAHERTREVPRRRC
ncbi:MAG: DNA alkylation repair protein [Candidatus Sericytochromatia bacterium]|nr:DNA alkylation repair protein [Candidatus Tanganyikabacteria bacterium]